MKRKVSFVVDDNQLFDTLKTVNGDTSGIGYRLSGTMLTGKCDIVDVVGLALYGITDVEAESLEHGVILNSNFDICVVKLKNGVTFRWDGNGPKYWTFLCVVERAINALRDFYGFQPYKPPEGFDINHHGSRNEYIEKLVTETNLELVEGNLV